MEQSYAEIAYGHLTLPAFSLLLTALLLFIALPVAAVTGFITGKRQRARMLARGQEIDMVVGEATLGAILALLGLLLAFTFGNALGLIQERKSAMVEEAAALGTAFLRADYLADPGRSDLKEALYAYAQTRLLPGNGQIATRQDAITFVDTTIAAQSRLWPLTLQATAEPTEPAIQSFVASAMNEVLDAHTRRMASLSVPVQEQTQLMQLIAALTALFLLGNRAGIVGRRLTWRTFVFSGFLFIVMITIVDMQRGNEGTIRTDASPLEATLLDMRLALGVDPGG